jgi:hypothetical protein
MRRCRGDVLLTYDLYIYTSARGADLVGGAVDGDNKESLRVSEEVPRRVAR